MPEWMCLYEMYDLPAEIKEGLEEIGQVDLQAEFIARLTLDVDKKYKSAEQ